MRSASASAFTTREASDETYALAWYCVQLIIDTIHDILSVPQDSKGKGKARPDNEKDAERLYRLHLTLISTISSLPLSLMLRALDQTRLLITGYPHDDSGAVMPGEKDRKAELVNALFTQLLEETGDREKEAAMQWWYKYRPTLIAESTEGGNRGAPLSQTEQKKQGGLQSSGDEPLLSRL